jgi:hypothetical protein
MSNIVDAVKALAIMPSLSMVDLNAKGILKFIKDFENFGIQSPSTRMAMCIAPSTWRSLRILPAFAHVSVESVVNETLGAMLFSIYGPPSETVALDEFREMKMKGTSTKVNLEDVLAVVGQWQFLLRWLDGRVAPSKKNMVKVFWDNVGPAGAVEEAKTLAYAESKSPSIRLCMELFVEISQKLFVQQQLDASAQKAQDRKRKGDQVDEGSVKRALTSLLSSDKDIMSSLSALSVPSPEGDASVVLMSKSQRKNLKKKTKKSLSLKVQPPGKVYTCFGCGHVGHTRDKCPHRDLPGYIANPGVAKGPISLKK